MPGAFPPIISPLVSLLHKTFVLNYNVCYETVAGPYCFGRRRRSQNERSNKLRDNDFQLRVERLRPRKNNTSSSSTESLHIYQICRNKLVNNNELVSPPFIFIFFAGPLTSCTSFAGMMITARNCRSISNERSLYHFCAISRRCVSCMPSRSCLQKFRSLTIYWRNYKNSILHWVFMRRVGNSSATSTRFSKETSMDVRKYNSDVAALEVES